MSNHHFSVKQLSERWGLSTGTLDHWRRYGKGPLFMKIGGHVLYRLSDIEAYEEASVRQETRKDQGELICQDDCSPSLLPG